MISSSSSEPRPLGKPLKTRSLEACSCYSNHHHQLEIVITLNWKTDSQVAATDIWFKFDIRFLLVWVIVGLTKKVNLHLLLDHLSTISSVTTAPYTPTLHVTPSIHVNDTKLTCGYNNKHRDLYESIKQKKHFDLSEPKRTDLKYVTME